MKGIWALLLMATGCNTRVTEQTHSVSLKDTVMQTAPVKPFANPALINGSDFLSFFSGLKMSYPGKTDTLLTYTSNRSKILHSKESILNLYQNINFNFMKKLKAINRQSDSLYILNYKCQVIGTTTLKTISVSIEKDTARILLPIKLNRFLD